PPLRWRASLVAPAGADADLVSGVSDQVSVDGTAVAGTGLVVFTASWCPLWKVAVDKVPGAVDVFQVDVDENAALAELWAVKVVPTVVAVRVGREQRRHTGPVDAAALKKLAAAIS